MKKVDFQMVVLSLRRAGVSLPSIARKHGYAQGTVQNLSTRPGHEPGYTLGAILVKEWVELGNKKKNLPMIEIEKTLPKARLPKCETPK